MTRKLKLIFAAIFTVILAALGGGTYLRERAAAQKAEQATKSIAEENRKNAGELAAARDREAREAALQKRAEAEAAAQQKADLDARITSLADYVKSRKR